MKLKIRAKITALLMIVALLPLILSGVLTYLSSKNALTKSTGEDFEIMSQNLMTTIDNNIHERLNDTQFFITDSSLVSPDVSNEEKSEVLKTHLFNLGFYNQISLTDAEGFIVASTDEDLIGKDASEEDWYEKIEKEFIGTSDFHYSPYTGKPTIILANLMLDKFKNPLGVVFAELTWNGVVELLDSSSEAEIVLVNQDNLEIGHSDDETGMLLGRDWTQVVEKFEEGNSGFGVYQNGREYLYAYSVSDGYLNYEGYKWKIFMRISTKIAFQQLNETLSLLLFIMIGTLLIVIVIGYEASRNIARPIQDVTKGVEAIERGNLDLEIPAQKNDEIGYLAQTFNKMTRTMKKRNAQLTASLGMAEEESQKYQTILENTKDAIILISPKKNIIAANSRFNAIFNIDKNLIGETQDEFLKDLEKVLEDGKIKKSIEEMQNGDSGSSFAGEFAMKAPLEGAVKLITTPIVNDKKEAQGYIWIFRDITEEKEIEEKKFNFITVASHQIRTPLTAVSWNIELLTTSELGELNKEQKSALDDISIGIKKTIKLADDLLNISKIEGGTMEVNPEGIDLKELIEGVKQELSTMAESRGITLNTEEVESGTKIKADRRDAQNAVTNIMMNAIMYSEKGDVKIKSSSAEGGEKVVLAVKDKGIGITMRDQEKIFSKFFRAPTAVKIQPDGSGLGLYITQKRMEANQGKIWFESKQDEGTTFYLEFIPSHA